MTTEDGIKRYSKIPGNGKRLAIVGVLLLTAAGCGELLDVTLPGVVDESALNDARLANTLVLGAEGDFECAHSFLTFMYGLWTTDFWHAGVGRELSVMQDRESVVFINDLRATDPSCEVQNAYYIPYHLARVQAERAIGLIEQFDEALVPNKDILLARSWAYAGYSTLLLGEAFCEVTFDAGPLVTREDTWRRAVENFTSALEHAGRVGGPDAAEAGSIRNMALIGRARARLNLGDVAGVVLDASQVPEGFVRVVDRSEANERRWNRIYDYGARAQNLSVHESYHNLEVDGVADPRVPINVTGIVGSDNVTFLNFQLKYTSRADPIPFATWREAQLMIAEVEGGQTAVDIINQLRTTVNDLPWVDNGHPGLPEFSSNDPAEIRDQVIEERRRELWLQGTRLGDMLRLDLPFLEGLDSKGTQMGPGGCLPLPERETIPNPNLN